MLDAITFGCEGKQLPARCEWNESAHGAHTTLKSDGGAAAFHVISRRLMGMFTARVIASMHIIATEAPDTSQNSSVRQRERRRTTHATEPTNAPRISAGIMRANVL